MNARRGAISILLLVLLAAATALTGRTLAGISRATQHEHARERMIALREAALGGLALAPGQDVELGSIAVTRAAATITAEDPRGRLMLELDDSGRVVRQGYQPLETQP